MPSITEDYQRIEELERQVVFLRDTINENAIRAEREFANIYTLIHKVADGNTLET